MSLAVWIGTTTRHETGIVLAPQRSSGYSMKQCAVTVAWQ